MKDIFSSYGNKSGLSTNEFFFLYGGNKINPDGSLYQLAGNSTAIQILVYSKTETANQTQIKKSTYIKCPQCLEPATIEF